MCKNVQKKWVMDTECKVGYNKINEQLFIGQAYIASYVNNLSTPFIIKHNKQIEKYKL